MVHGCLKFGWEYIIDKWKYPEIHLSLQVILPSGLNVNLQLIYHVSTNQDKYVLSLPCLCNFQSAERAFYSYLGEEKHSLDDIKEKYEEHAKIIARDILMAKILKRDPAKETLD